MTFRQTAVYTSMLRSERSVPRVRSPRFPLIAPLLLLCILASPALTAQPVSAHFQRYSLAHGLSQSSVFSIVQDSTGFLWIGTEDGLNRFDGFSFTVYRNDPSDPHSLSNGWIEHLFVDRKGVLWIGTFGGGLNRYDARKDRFVRYTDILPSEFVRAIAEDDRGSLWIGTQKGLTRLDPRTGATATYRHDPNDTGSISNDHIRALHVDRRGRVWIGTIGGGVCRYDERTDRFLRIAGGTDSSGGPHRGVVRTVTEDETGTIWAGTRDGLERFDETRRRFVTVPMVGGPNGGNIYDVRAGGHGTLWIGTGGDGVVRFDASSGLAAVFRHDPTDPLSVSLDNVWKMFIDRTGVVWAGTLGGGLNRLLGTGTPFVHVRRVPQDSNGLASSVTWSLLEDTAGHLWVGTDGSVLHRYDARTASWHRYAFGSASGAHIIRALCEDRSGDLWAGTSRGWFGRFDRSKERFVPFAGDSTFLSAVAGVPIRCIVPGAAHELWVGTFGAGAFAVNTLTGAAVRYRSTADGPHGLGSDMVTSILYDSGGVVWIGTREGLNRVDVRSGRVDRFRNDTASDASLSGDYVHCIIRDANGRRWIGTRHGLDRFNERDGTFRRYGEREGMPNGVVSGIVEDRRGVLWLSTNRGISRFDTESGTFRTYDERDGTGGSEYNAGAFGTGASGRIFFGGPHGITMFDPGAFTTNHRPPTVVLTAFSVQGVPPESGTAVPHLTDVSLEYHQRSFTFEFAALDYTSPERNRVAYRLEGFDDAWNDAGDRRFAGYTNLDPGTYRLTVKGANNDGVWSERGAEMRITVVPAVWQTWWFRALVILAVAGAGWGVYRYRLGKLLAVERMRNRIARDLHDDVSATLSGITYFAESVRTNGAGMNSGARRFVDLISESATSAQESINDIVWSLNPENDDWRNILTKFRRFASDLLESKGIRYTIHFPEAMPSTPWSMERRRDLWLVYKEMVTNIARHSGASEATIALTAAADGVLELVVTDNGSGFDPSVRTDRNGVRNIRSRAERMNARVHLDTAPGGGVRWRMTCALR